MRAARSARIAAAALCAWIAGADAAPFPYDADVDRFGAAIAVPTGRREGVLKAMEYCGATFPDLGWNAYSAYGRWVRRHAAFLQLTIAMRRALETEAAQASAADGDRWDRVRQVDVPKRGQDLSAGMLRAVSGPDSEAAKKQACAETIAALQARKLDLDAAEPAIAKYLRDLSGRFRITLPAPTEDVASGAPEASRDAQALVCKWTTEKIRFYLPDGRVSEDDAQCTLEFSGKMMTSDCQVSGRLVRVVSSYEVKEPGRYESTVVENADHPEMIGAKDVTLFRVENRKLVQSSYLPIASADPFRPVEIEAVLAPGVLSGRRSR
jgi:hypothetical protein